MNFLLIILIVLGPLIGILYATLDYLGVIDKWTKLNYAEQALARLESTAGFPQSWIFNDSLDQKHFKEIFRIIKKRTKQGKIIKVLEEGHKPSLLTVGGTPIRVNGIPENWSQEEKYNYTDSHPIILAFNVQRSTDSKAKGDKVCTIGELRTWVKKEKDKYSYIVGAIVIGLIAIALGLWQFVLS